jgi:hypothetical protein
MMLHVMLQQTAVTVVTLTAKIWQCSAHRKKKAFNETLTSRTSSASLPYYRRGWEGGPTSEVQKRQTPAIQLIHSNSAVAANINNHQNS